MPGSAFSETPGSGQMEVPPHSASGRPGNLITTTGTRLVSLQTSANQEPGRTGPVTWRERSFATVQVSANPGFKQLLHLDSGQ